MHVNHPRSAPPSPRGGILLSSHTYGGSTAQPLAYRQRNHSSSSLPVTPPPSQQCSAENTSQSFERQSYQPTEWSLLAIERPEVKAKYTVSLLHHPTMTLYTWPIDPRKPPLQGTCYKTPLKPDIQDFKPTATLRQSLQVLEDCLRTWIRQTRSRSPLGSGKLIVQASELEWVANSLQLRSTTLEQRSHWLSLQQVPDVIPTSTPTSPARTPPAIPEDGIHSPTGSSDSSRRPPSRTSTLSPLGHRRTPQPLSPIINPPSRNPPSVQPPSDISFDGELNKSPTPVLSLTEPSPVLESMSRFEDSASKSDEMKHNIHSAIQALRLNDDATNPHTAASS